MSCTAGGKPGRTVGAKACQTNPFLKDSLTAKELRTPSRALPVLEAGGGKPSRYLQVWSFLFEQSQMKCFVVDQRAFVCMPLSCFEESFT
jgi:hypothetical protein